MRGGMCDKRTSTLSARPINYLTIEILDDTTSHAKARYWSKIGIFAYCTPNSTTTLRGFPSEYCHRLVAYGKL